MFRYEHNRSRRSMRLAIVSLLLLSASSLIISLWFVVDFAHEQEIVESLLADLPSRDLPVAQELAGELQWQSRWTLLVIVQVVATALAVTLLSRAYLSSQDRLNDVKALAADILSSMEQAVITCDADGIVTSLNHRTTELLGLTLDPFGRSLRQLTDKIDLAAFRAEADSHSSHSAERDFSVLVNSNRIWLRGFCQPLRNSEGEVIGNVFQLRDVTADRHLQERIARMERFMGLGSLAAGLHHEIKNPLAAVSLHLQLVEEQLAEQSVPKEVPEMLEIIKTELKRTGQVLESFRDYASNNKLDVSQVDLASLLKRQTNLLRPRANANGVKINLQLQAGLPDSMQLDSSRIEQIVHNLIVNAIEAMPSGGEITIDARPSREADSDGVLMTFSDTGSGIPEDIRDHIFDAYFTTKGQGTGMGLAISDKIVRQHGGRLDLIVADAGTSFELFLPT